jgi:uncharacterized protein (TIGR02421 family)
VKVVSSEAKNLENFKEWDKRLVQVGKTIKVLTALTWPEKLFEDFQASNQSKLPKAPLPKVDFKDGIAELQKILDGVDRGHPIGEYLYLTAFSYLTAARMLESAGTPLFTELSRQLYGDPTDLIGTDGMTHLNAADQFIEMTRDCIDAQSIPENDYCLTAQTIADEVRKTLVPFFSDHKIEVIVEPELASKAAAGAGRIRLRGRTCFSAMDLKQLLHHEGFVHMLTALNGRGQPNLASMGLGSPRTTRSQEGLATFAELITSSIDLGRLRRIALRIRGVHLALQGADFIEVFRFFLAEGQDEKESFLSAGRVFRGGNTEGRICFTKDVVYLQGLIFTHTFLRKAVQANRLDYVSHLFAGRMALGDAVALDPYFKSGFIVAPKYEPPWLHAKQSFAAYLVYSVFANRISLNHINLEDFVTRQI